MKKCIVLAFAIALVLAIAPVGNATLLTNGGAESGNLSGWSTNLHDCKYQPIAAVESQSESAGTVYPYDGTYFFTFAAASTECKGGMGGDYEDTISMYQTGTTGLDAPALTLSGYVQTELWDSTHDEGEAVLTIYDSGWGYLDSATSGSLTTDNVWEYFEVSLVVPELAAYWKVELIGTKYYTNYVNVFWDELELLAVPEPATMLLLGTGLIGLAGFSRKKFFRN